MKLATRMAAFALLAALLVVGTAQAGDTIRKVMPENGLTVILKENHSSPVVNMRFYVKAGSIYEDEYLGCGISHYVEHLLSDGTTTRTLEDIEDLVDNMGGGYNAYTTKDHTCYYMETSSEHFDEALDLLSDQAMNATLPQEAVDAQFGVITREINMGYDEPGRRIYNMFGEVMFRRHPARYPVIGYIENYQRLKREDVVKYVDRMYVPNNMVFVAVGDFDADVAYEKISEAFRDFERMPIDRPALEPEPPQQGRRVLREQRDLDMAYVIMGFHTIPITHPDLYPLDIMSHILSEGTSSRLHKKLVDELGLVYNVTTWSHTPSYDAGTFAISMQLDPANIDEALRVATEEIYKLQDKKVSKDELRKAKKLKTAEFYFGNQNMAAIAGNLGRSEVTTGNPDFDALYAERIQDVTAEQIMEVANKYFYDDNIGVAILEPMREDEVEKKVAEKPEISEIQRHVLDNGLTLLVRENHSTPTVSLSSFTLGGVRFEEGEKNGVANFTAAMFPRGTRKRSAEKISETLDAMGADYYSAANHTRIQTGVTVLAEDFEDGLDIFADMLMNPQFDAKEMEKERELIKAAILSRADNWTYDAMDRMTSALFQEHPYGQPPLGTDESVSSIVRDDLVDHHAKFVVPNNTVITIFGDIDDGEALALAEKTFGKWRSGEKAKASRLTERPRTEAETLTSHHSRAQTVIFRGYQGMPYGVEDTYAMDVLDGVISGIGLPGGWLHTDLRGNGLVYVVHAYNWTGIDSGYFGIYAATFDEALDQAMEIIDHHMDRIVAEEVSEDELATAKRLCVITNQTQNQTNAAQAMNAGIAELYGLGYDYPDTYAEKIEAVTTHDVLEVANKYLHNPVTILRRPQPAEEEAVSQAE